LTFLAVVVRRAGADKTGRATRPQRGKTLETETLVAAWRTLAMDCAAAFSQWAYQQQVLLQNQQMINAMGQPRMTNCQYVGTMLNCTTF